MPGELRDDPYRRLRKRLFFSGRSVHQMEPADSVLIRREHHTIPIRRKRERLDVPLNVVREKLVTARLEIEICKALEFRSAIRYVIDALSILAELRIRAVENRFAVTRRRDQLLCAGLDIERPEIALVSRSEIRQDQLAIVRRPIEHGPIFTRKLSDHVVRFWVVRIDHVDIQILPVAPVRRIGKQLSGVGPNRI